MNAEKKLEELGIELPASSEPKAMYIPVKQTGNLLFVSGQIPFLNGELVYKGKLGGERTLEEGQAAARLCTINLLSAAKYYLGDLDRITNVIKIQAFVSSVTGFEQQHLVANGISELLYQVFGEKGRHTRTAVSVNQLPMDATVEIEAILEVA